MKKSITKEETKKEVTNNLVECLSLWISESKNGNEYLSGKLSSDLGGSRVIGYFNTNKKNPKEPDVRVYTLDNEGKQDKEIASLWENVSKNEIRYLTGTSDEKEKLLGFYGDKDQVKLPYIRVYFNNN